MSDHELPTCHREIQTASKRNGGPNNPRCGCDDIDSGRQGSRRRVWEAVGPGPAGTAATGSTAGPDMGHSITSASTAAGTIVVHQLKSTLPRGCGAIANQMG